MLNKSNEIKMGMRKSFNDVNSKIANRVCYGYTKLSNGDLIINKDESEVVKFIFDSYNSGNSLGKIVKLLGEVNIISPTGKSKWNKETINKLISNEKYVGSVLLQKTCSVLGEQIVNSGQLEKFMINGHHEPILSLEVFENTQKLKLLRMK